MLGRRRGQRVAAGGWDPGRWGAALGRCVAGKSGCQVRKRGWHPREAELRTALVLLPREVRPEFSGVNDCGGTFWGV